MVGHLQLFKVGGLRPPDLSRSLDVGTWERFLDVSTTRNVDFALLNHLFSPLSQSSAPANPTVDKQTHTDKQTQTKNKQIYVQRRDSPRAS